MREILQHELSRGGAGHPMLEVRGLMELEFELARRDQIPFLLLHAEIDGIARIAPTREREVLVWNALVARFCELARTGDLLAYQDGPRLVVAIARTPLEAGLELARAWIEMARHLTVATGERPVRASLAIGVAERHGDQDYDFETLVHVANDGLEVAMNSGAECASHTELYGLYQKKIDRERPRREPKLPLAVPASVAPAAQSHANSTPAATAVAPGAKSVLVPHGNSHPVTLAPVVAPDLSNARAALVHAAPRDVTVESFEVRLKELAQSLAQEAVQKSLDALAREHEAETERLERRIAKLARQLAAAEDELRHTAAPTDEEPGVASAYKQVQGLTPEDRGYGAKLALLSQILEANLELRRQLRTAH